jgi:Xaa-Pro aminopeptidase
MPGLYLIINTQGDTILFGNENTIEDEIWSGKLETIAENARRSGITLVRPLAALDSYLKNNGPVHYLPPYSADRKLFLAEKLGIPIHEVAVNFSKSLVKAVVDQRSIKSDSEVEQIENAFTATELFHVEAMKMALPGEFEYKIAGQIEGTMIKHQSTPAFQVICTIHGETLHNEFYGNQLKKGQLLLVDAGAENKMHYASDITRTTPVGGRFDDRQKDVYQTVLNAQLKAISEIRPGVYYRDIHLLAAREITVGLMNLGLLKGNPDEIINSGAHALFFPHGLGHMMGLDVHDMEDLGEDNVGYDETVHRSEQFGTAYLRMAKKLKPGHVLTVEPGVYFIPALIEKWEAEKLFTQYINYSEVKKFIGFGGIRIEDNVLITTSGNRLLGKPIPKTIQEIESFF